MFGARAAFIHVGALIGTIMVWNVFFHIIPGQKRMVEAIRAGREPDPRSAIIGKQRSVHNTYFTLPVLFIMISNHFPMTFGHPYAWLVLAVIMLAGALIRQYFVLRHSGRNAVALPASRGRCCWLGVALALAPAPRDGGREGRDLRPGAADHRRALRGCHAEQPTRRVPAAAGGRDAGYARADRALRRDQQQTVATQLMPLGNLTQMTDDERARVATWLAQGAPVD